ncbi:MAG: B12-binding domain-containing radical SAM protein [Christensenella sp.]
MKFVSKKANFPPLGLITVASLLPAEWDKKLVDMNVEKLRDKDILWADYVFISAMVIQKESTHEVIARCKALGIKTVGGGPLFTAEHMEFDDVDHILMYEGELSIPQFLADLDNGTPKHLYEWIGWPEITETPVPAWELIKTNKYTMLNLQYSRGCPFNCEFCNVVSLFGHKPRTKTITQLIDELERIYACGWRGSVFFVDDNFIGNRNKLKKEVLPVIIAWMKEKNYPFKFFTEVSVNLADDDELMNLMVAAGFDNVFVGIETVSEESLAECHKTQNTNRDLEKSVNIIQQKGIQVQGGFILGFDSDKATIFERMTSFIQKSGIVTAMVGMLNAPKGTELYKRLKKEGRLATDFSGTNTDINFVPRMNIDKLRAGYKKVVETIYSPKRYFERVKGFLKRYTPPIHTRKNITFGNIVSFVKASFILGIISKERVYYWKLFFWSLFKKPAVLAMAVTFTVYGYHFRKSLNV